MQIVQDAALKLGVKPFQVFVKTYEDLGLDAKSVQLEARDSWDRYRLSKSQRADDEVIDFCIKTLDPRKERDANQAPEA